MQQRSWWRVYAAAGTVVVAGYFALPGGIPRDIVYVAVGLSCALVMCLAVRSQPAGARRAWYVIALGQCVWVAGDATYSWYEHVRHVPPSPSTADALYLAAYPVMAGGLLLLGRERRVRDRSALIDSLIVAVGLAVPSWAVLARPAVLDATAPRLERLLALAYPVADIGLLALLVWFVSTPGARTTAARLIITATGLLLVADTTYSLLNLANLPVRGVDLLWLGSYVLWGTAALHPSSARLSEPQPAAHLPFTPLRLVVLGTTTLIAPGTLAVELTLHAQLDAWAVAGSSSVLFVLVVTRMYAAIGQAGAATRQRELLETDLAHRSAHDALTELPNRSQALMLTQAALHRGQRSGAATGLLFLDLDDFKAVNDTFGHDVGDEVLRQVAGRLLRLVRAGDVVGRIGGDEFVVLVEPVLAEPDLVELADRLLAALARPMLAQGSEVTVGASVGIAICRDGCTAAGDLLHEADTAAHRARARGRGQAEVFDLALRQELQDRTALERAVREGLLGEQFVLYYQPVVDLACDGVSGYEALIRWQRPGHGLVPPDEFIPLAEASDLICDLGRWVLARATTQLAGWLAGGTVPDDVTVAVNISGRHLVSPEIVADVAAALAAADLSAANLVLEITETLLVDDPVASVHLRELRELGVAVSLDDFGTGYTSIAQLQNLPVDSLKIDRSFVGSAEPQASELVRLMVSAAHAFGLRVVAEGVERVDQLAALREVGCDSAQGYLFARPMPAADVGPRSASVGQLQPSPAT